MGQRSQASDEGATAKNGANVARNVTVNYSLPLDRVWTAKRSRRANRQKFNCTLCMLNLATWLYTALSAARLLAS